MQWTFQVALAEPTCQCRRLKRCGLDPWSGRPLVEGMAIHSSYSCLVNRLGRGRWPATVQNVAKSRHD